MFGKARFFLTAMILLSGIILQGCDTSHPPESRLKTALAKSEQCVEPTALMRTNHMEFIKHMQDDTVYGGIRGTKHELKACINCHVPAASEDGKPLNYLKDNETGELNEEHFCATCHKYAVVKLNCFECHSDNPQNEGVAPNTAAHKIPALTSAQAKGGSHE
ncbi:MAG: Unknown protein [uncultured Thiotrichaceae bacterium]|uniref:Uncharacterized protein n=1 Tax=uncultured Thiotrichaceae bacterium TaxID=298394 RepID=A0A6S6UHS8_9GAMM|nr:MAG: Unknown protein [uncultured Thiotrichaceae bacterium]